MKKNKMVFALLGCVAFLSSCEARLNELSFLVETPSMNSKEEIVSNFFPEDDDSKLLSGTAAQRVESILAKLDPHIALLPGETQITDKQYKEIKEFTDRNLAVPGYPFETFSRIYKWVVENIKYDFGPNDAYSVFVNKKGVCQGYANILKIMAISQEIPVVIVNGYLYGGGHAWNYAYIDKKWKVSDPTNNNRYNNNLEPVQIDANVYEDNDFIYNYNFGHLNIKQVKAGNEQLTIPFSVLGFRVTSFDPETILPKAIQEIYLGKNIEILGVDCTGLKNHGRNVREVFVEKENPYIENYKGVLYRKKENPMTPYYIPYTMERIELKPVEVVSKNFILGLPNLTEIVFTKGTKVIENYAIEDCKNLEKAYVPYSVKEIQDNAFKGVNENFEIIRVGEGTGIPTVTL